MNDLRFALRQLLKNPGFTAVGGGLGLMMTFFATRLFQAQLYGVSAHDPFTLVSVFAVLGGVTVVAALVPAWRASRLDPLNALRGD